MHLSDIIKEDSDRLFIVDTECFIIFTGASINDERPFIRIGTWYDLPVEIIPLVENIIVSDRILGNPSYEQFNIDVRNLETNRYIGGESILKRFLEYQRIFGLDLTNVSLVNIEKDIPELSSQKNISDRDQFIGIFYSDGNIKINRDGKNIFDLNTIDRDNLNNAEILTKISVNSKNTERYKGAGLIIIDNNPIFYQKGYFTSYQYPDKCLGDFSLLQIDPNYIRELLLPSQNLINISGFMKFKNHRGGKIKLYSDNTEQIELIKKLFKNSTVSDEKFSNLHINTSDGLKISSYAGSPNIKLTYKPGDEKDEEIVVPFIKSPVDTAKILKEKSDAVMITYTAYEESALLFKSTESPVIIIDDGNINIKKISHSDNIILKPGIQYDFKKYKSSEILLKEFTGLDEIQSAIDNFDREKLDNLISSLIGNSEQSLELLNLPSLIKFFIANTTDRKKYSALREIYQNFNTKINFNPAPEFKSSMKIVLALYNNSCCTIIKQTSSNTVERFIDDYNESAMLETTLNHEQKILCKRIIEDRERLTRLLGMFYKEITKTPSYSEIEKEVSLLKNEIFTRKDVYTSEFYSINNSNDRKKQSKNILNQIPTEKKEIVKTDKETTISKNISESIFSNKKIIFPASLIILILLAAAFFITRNKTSQPGATSEFVQHPVENQHLIITVKRVNEQEKELLLKHKVKISESDIYNYSNDVAVKNGYDKLSYTGLKNKNPHWIFPSNIFIMLDGEKVVVQKGDTLWDLAHAKLEKMNADFYKIIDEIEKSGTSDKNKLKTLITEAEKNTYMKQQIEILNVYKERMKNE